jgi:hypothetical protein
MWWYAAEVAARTAWPERREEEPSLPKDKLEVPAYVAALPNQRSHHRTVPASLAAL